MNKPLLGSLALAAILYSDASAATIYERFEAMEKEMQGLQSEVTDLRQKQTEAEEAAKAEEEEAPEDEEPEDGEESDEDEDDEDEEEDINEILEDMQESITDLTKATSGNHIKFSIDFRSTYDSVKYDMVGDQAYNFTPVSPTGQYVAPDYAAGLQTVRDEHHNNDLLSNRLWLNMNWAATENISFTGQLAYNKLYGGRFGDAGPTGAFEDFDWFQNENPSDGGEVRVKSAYMFYRNDTFLGTDIPWTFSIGRRPSTNGHLINLRDDDVAASPSGHTINVEFDGISSKFGLENLTGVEGMYLKFCFGQGITNASDKNANTPFANNANSAAKDTHLAGLIFVPYDDGQYQFGTQIYGATNLPGLDSNRGEGNGGTVTINDSYGNSVNAIVGTIRSDFVSQGDLYSGTAWFITNGIGDELSDFLDDTTFFVSGAMSRTNPDDGLDTFGQTKSMLGSTDMENGYSYWVGLQMPSLVSEEGRFGLEFNHGSQYWRSFTYAEDTLIGSKMAVRGDAYEVYFTEPLIDDILSLQIRYTYLDYSHAGSNGFFGSTSGSALSISDIASNPLTGRSGTTVDTAQDIRVYLRYRY